MFPLNTQILVVDDMMTMRKLITKSFADLGYSNFVEASDGEQAWEILKSTPTISLVVSDWNMPKMTGIELLKKVREDKDIKTKPFILITTEAEMGQLVNAIQLGVSGYILKPFTSDLIRENLATVFSKIQSAKPL